MPSPMYSGTQVQVKLPGVFVQLASELQPPLFTAHSSISTSSQGDVEWNSWTEVKEVQYVVQENRSLPYYRKCSEVNTLTLLHTRGLDSQIDEQD